MILLSLYMIINASFLFFILHYKKILHRSANHWYDLCWVLFKKWLISIFCPLPKLPNAISLQLPCFQGVSKVTKLIWSCFWSFFWIFFLPYHTYEIEQLCNTLIWLRLNYINFSFCTCFLPFLTYFIPLCPLYFICSLE